MPLACTRPGRPRFLRRVLLRLTSATSKKLQKQYVNKLRLLNNDRTNGSWPWWLEHGVQQKHLLGIHKNTKSIREAAPQRRRGNV